MSQARLAYQFNVILSLIALGVLLITGSRAIATDSSRPSAKVMPPQFADKVPAAGIPVRWALDFNWSPFTPSGLQIQYDSSTDPYTAAPVVLFPTGKGVWHTYTWKLTNMDFSGLQNAGADLRLTDSTGIAVHEVVLSLQPPKLSTGKPGAVAGAAARIIFNTHRSHRNTELNMRQVAEGGEVLDSKYTCGDIGDRSAEIFAASPSYIYLRISRRSNLFRKHPKVVYVTIVYAADRHTVAWPRRTFARMRSRGIHYAEINLPWGAVEPARGHFNFKVLDQTLANAAEAHIRVIPIFWYSVWPGNPPLWISKYDMGPTGISSQSPAWWSHFNRSSYFSYVEATINHIKNSRAFGGAFLSFGWLDYMWGPAPGGHGIWWHRGEGVNGYAPADVARFHLWLPSRYHCIRHFNQRYDTDYRSWNGVPAAAPGQRLFRVYQRFRNWSVLETYSHLAAIARRETSAPLYFYCGGGFYGAGVAFNEPDTFFQVARRYHVVVELDWADSTGLALLFGSLAVDYHVPLFEEWSAGTRLYDDMAKFLSHYALGAPEEAGMDFILYRGGRKYTLGFPQYVRAIPELSQIRGAYPLQPVAVYISYHCALSNPGALSGIAGKLGRIWRRMRIAYTVVTNREVKAGIVRLAQFHAIFPITGRHDEEIADYAAHGGHVLLRASQLANYAHAYISFQPSTKSLESVPTTDRTTHTAWVAFSRWPSKRVYNGVAKLNLKALELPPGRYHIMDMATGQRVNCVAVGGALQALVHVLPGKLLVWRIQRVPAIRPAGLPTHSRKNRLRPVETY